MSPSPALWGAQALGHGVAGTSTRHQDAVWSDECARFSSVMLAKVKEHLPAPLPATA
jgi:hypothetical protein